MRNIKTKVFVVCEDHEYKGENKVIGLFPTREEAENAIRARGEVRLWRTEYFLPFALVWVFLQTVHKDYGPLQTCCWIEVHEFDAPVKRPQFYKEVIAMLCCAFCILAVPVLHLPPFIATALVLLSCLGVMIAFGSAFLKA